MIISHITESERGGGGLRSPDSLWPRPRHQLMRLSHPGPGCLITRTQRSPLNCLNTPILPTLPHSVHLSPKEFSSISPLCAAPAGMLTMIISVLFTFPDPRLSANIPRSRGWWLRDSEPEPEAGLGTRCWLPELLRVQSRVSWQLMVAPGPWSWPSHHSPAHHHQVS